MKKAIGCFTASFCVTCLTLFSAFVVASWWIGVRFSAMGAEGEDPLIALCDKEFPDRRSKQVSVIRKTSAKTLLIDCDGRVL